MRFLLDTNIISNVVDQPDGSPARKIRKVLGDDSEVFTSIVVVAEIRYGYTKIQSARLRNAYDRFFESIPIEGWEEPFDVAYAELRTALERIGKPIGAMDMMIAAHAVATDAVVVTANERHFSQVPGLKTENWLQA